MGELQALGDAVLRCAMFAMAACCLAFIVLTLQPDPKGGDADDRIANGNTDSDDRRDALTGAAHPAKHADQGDHS